MRAPAPTGAAAPEQKRAPFRRAPRNSCAAWPQRSASSAARRFSEPRPAAAVEDRKPNANHDAQDPALRLSPRASSRSGAFTIHHESAAKPHVSSKLKVGTENATGSVSPLIAFCYGIVSRPDQFIFNATSVRVAGRMRVRTKAAIRGVRGEKI